MAAFEQFCRDGDHLESIWPDVLREHPDCYVAVYREELVAFHQTLDAMPGSGPKCARRSLPTSSD